MEISKFIGRLDRLIVLSIIEEDGRVKTNSAKAGSVEKATLTLQETIEGNSVFFTIIPKSRNEFKI